MSRMVRTTLVLVLLSSMTAGCGGSDPTVKGDTKGGGGGGGGFTMVMELPRPNLGFDRESDLDEWMITSEGSGEVQLDDSTSYHWNRSLRVTPDRCTNLTMREGVTLSWPGEMYRISLAVRRAGGVVGCAAPLLVSLTQGGQEILYESLEVEDGGDWEVLELYFQPETDNPVKVDFDVGYEKLWMDDLRIEFWGQS